MTTTTAIEAARRPPCHYCGKLNDMPHHTCNRFAYNNGYADGQAALPQWRPINSDTPRDIPLLAAGTYGSPEGVKFVRQIEANSFAKDGKYYRHDRDYVTDYMPLPQPPATGDEE